MAAVTVVIFVVMVVIVILFAGSVCAFSLFW